MSIPLRVLIIEDSEDDTLLLVRELRRGGFDLAYQRVETAETMQEALCHHPWDLIVCDYAMPHFSGLEALRLFRETGKDTPFLVVSGTIGEDIAVNTMLAGARDYIMKDRLSRLVPAVQRELREAQERRARQDAERALQAAQAHSARIITHTPAIICGMDVDGIITFVNPAAESITGYSAAEMIGQDAWELFYPGEYHQQVNRLFEEFMHGDVHNYEMVLITKSGEKRTILWNSMNEVDDTGRLVQVVGFGNDITARKQAEEALRANEARYRTLFETSMDAIFLEDLEGNILDCNGRAHEMHGYTKAELLALHSRDLIPAATLKTLIPEMNTQLAAKGMAFLEAEGIHKNGTIFPTEVSIQLTTMAGKPLTVVYVRDITERKQAEAALKRYRDHLEDLVRQRTTELKTANEHLTELSRIKDEFISNVTHELRTPITSLKLRQYLLSLDTEKVEEHLGVIRRETDRLAHIIDGLLHLSRLDQGRVPFNPAPISLNALAEQYALDRTPLAEHKGLSLRFEGTMISPIVLADERLLGQGISILLTNALNYTPPGGQITVCTETRLSNGQAWGRLLVHDTGPGIDPDDRPRLFERFFRGKVGLQSGAPGTGLGLALAKEIVQLHQGRIDLLSDDQSGEGATFMIELPIHRTRTPEETTPGNEP